MLFHIKNSIFSKIVQIRKIVQIKKIRSTKHLYAIIKVNHRLVFGTKKELFCWKKSKNIIAFKIDNKKFQ